MEQQTKTLWMGNIESYMDESFVVGLYSSRGIQVNSVKIVRNAANPTGMSYAFVDFLDRATAERTLGTLNNTPHGGGSSGTFRLNWATHSAGNRMPGMPPSVEYSMYVGDLGPSVTDAVLAGAFNRYRSVKSARVVMDHGTGMSKGFGFVKFTSEEELNRALVEMQGQLIGERTVRVSPALPRDVNAAPAMTPVTPTPQWAPPYAAPSYNYGNYYPANYGYYPEQYSGYTANYGYPPYYNSHVPTTSTAGYGNGTEHIDEAAHASIPDLASESRDWQPFNVAQDNERYVAAQLHVLTRYYTRPRVTSESSV
jgi:RNA recognition motif-containing protein